MRTYTVVDEDNLDNDLKTAVREGKVIQCYTPPLGWLDIDNPEFRCGCTYRIKPKELDPDWGIE